MSTLQRGYLCLSLQREPVMKSRLLCFQTQQGLSSQLAGSNSGWGQFYQIMHLKETCSLMFWKTKACQLMTRLQKTAFSSQPSVLILGYSLAWKKKCIEDWRPCFYQTPCCKKKTSEIVESWKQMSDNRQMPSISIYRELISFFQVIDPSRSDLLANMESEKVEINDVC